MSKRKRNRKTKVPKEENQSISYWMGNVIQNGHFADSHESTASCQFETRFESVTSLTVSVLWIEIHIFVFILHYSSVDVSGEFYILNCIPVPKRNLFSVTNFGI